MAKACVSSTHLMEKSGGFPDIFKAKKKMPVEKPKQSKAIARFYR